MHGEVDATSSMGRGFDVLSALAALTSVAPFSATVSAVAARLQRDRSQVSRTLASLEALGLVVRGDDRAYRLGWDWYAAAQELTDRRLRVDGIDVLERLSSAADEACFLGALAGDRTVTIVESVPPSSRMIGSWIGRAYPAYCSDAGQAVLWDADDDEVRAVLAGTRFASAGPNAPTSADDFLERLHAARARGFAIVDEEAEPGLYSVSAPVHDFRREVVAAVQVVGERVALAPRTAELGALCVEAADELSRRLGATVEADRPDAGA
ncbi:IclR family transcriptional regulator [Agromyces aurantiacus]|uniref:IclR family transcriptional regulator n=1 Tax=Agromyces aurantiacus TaxID=165814 RepID=A0ABV9R5T0_9MICO|nr:IclR family transcriptional regulator [Agromyces aurantiacus]MBM7503660.1 DNA-binding IclR family transcriptional regulator [Agromyces aurantiacus]